MFKSAICQEMGASVFLFIVYAALVFVHPSCSSSTPIVSNRTQRSLTIQSRHTSCMIYATMWHTVRCRYNAVNFLTNIHKRHPISRPLRRGMGCLLCIQHLSDILLPVVIYVISKNVGPRYNGTRLYILRSMNHKLINRCMYIHTHI